METKKIFWKLVNSLEGVSDTIVKNQQGVVIERGMMLSNDYSVMYVIDEGFIKICNSDNESLLEFDEDSLLLEALSELFEDIYLSEQAKTGKVEADFINGETLPHPYVLNELEELKKRVAALEGQAQNQIAYYGNLVISPDKVDGKDLAEAVNTYVDKKEAAPEVPVQKQPKGNLSYFEKRKIKQDIIHVLANSNLSIKQSKEVLSEVSQDFEDCRPWDKANH